MGGAGVHLRRRELLRGVAALAGSPVCSIVAPSKAAAALDPTTALMIANTSLNVLSAFSGSSDGGLATMLQALSAKLDLLSRQVAEVQEELAKVAAAVGQLPARIQEQLTNESILEQIRAIRGSASEWQEVRRRESFLEPGPLAETDRRDLERVRADVRRARFILAANPEIGEKPLAATVAMVALALETSVESRLNGSGAGLRQSLESYIDWFTRIVDARRATSTATSYSNFSKLARDAVVVLFDSPHIKGAPPSDAPLDFTIVAGTPPIEVAWPNWDFRGSTAVCYQEYRPAFATTVTGGGSPGSTTSQSVYIPERFGQKPVVHHAWQVTSTVRDGVRVWHAYDATIPARSGTPPSDWNPEFGLAACEPRRIVMPFSSSLQQAEQAALRQPAITSSLKALEEIKGQIRHLNELEARKTFAARSIEVAKHALQQARVWRLALG